jgi:hypothetical protein
MPFPDNDLYRKTFSRPQDLPPGLTVETAETGVYDVALRTVDAHDPARPEVGRRLARVLKRLLRDYDFECVGVTGRPMMPTDHLPETNRPGRWRPRRRHARTRKETT